MSDRKQMVRQGILASSRRPGEGPSEQTDFFKVDSVGKRRLLYCCHRAKSALIDDEEGCRVGVIAYLTVDDD